MRPRTSASAVASGATRSPSRPSNACRTASLTSCVSAGSGVSFSKGSIATVLTLGRVPPLKPYGQPASSSPVGLTTAAPLSRRNDRRSVDRDHRELKPGPSPRWKIDARACGPLPGVEGGTAPRDAVPSPPPLGFEPDDAPRAVGRHIVERILCLRKPPHDAPRRASRSRTPTPPPPPPPPTPHPRPQPLGRRPRSPPPLGFEPDDAPRAVGRHIVERILCLRKPPHDAPRRASRSRTPTPTSTPTRRIRKLGAKYVGVGRRRPQHAERRPQHRDRGDERPEVFLRVRPEHRVPD